MNPELRKKIGQYKADKLKQDLPQYGDGGKKFAAGLAGFTTKIPMIGKVVDPMISNTKLAKEYDTAFNAGQMVGGVANTVANAVVGNVPGAISSGADTVQEGLEMGSSIASNNNNQERAKRLTGASQGFGAVEGISGMFNTSQFGGQGNPMQMFSGNIPVEMKNGGSIHIDPSKKGTFKAQATRMGMGVQEAASKILNAPEGTYSPEMRKKANFAKNFAKEDGGWLDGYESTITRLPNNMAAWSYKDGGSLINFKGPKHEDGGIPIDNNLKVNPFNPTAEVEGGESADPKQNYIFSDTLKPMNTKRTFAEISKSIDNKYKNNEDPITVKSKERELARLAQANEEVRLAKEAKSNPLKMKNGGNLPKYFKGGPFDEESNSYNPYGLGSGTVNTFGTNQVESMNTMTPSVMLGDYTPNNIVPENTIPTNMIKVNSISTGKTPFGLAGNLETTPKVPNQFVGNNYKTPNVNNNQQFTTGDKFQLAGLAPATIYNTIQALRPAEKFSPLTSPLFGSGLNDMNQNVRFNTNPILMNRNVGANQINQGSTSDGIRRANLQSLYRGTNTQLSEMAERETLANAQIRQQLGQAKIGVGAQDVAAQERARALNIDARRAKQQFGATAASQFGQGLTEFGKASNQGLSNRIGYDVLKNIAPNFTLTEYNNLVKKGMSDAEIIKFIKSK